jgi:hypothetical protein
MVEGMNMVSMKELRKGKGWEQPTRTLTSRRYRKRQKLMAHATA